MPLSNALIDRLFLRMHAMYGTLWLDMWKDLHVDPAKAIELAKGVWAEDLGRYSPETIGGAIECVRRAGKTFPPTLPEFIGHCESVKPAPLTLSHQTYQQRLPEPSVDAVEARERCMATARKLGMLPALDAAVGDRDAA